MRAELAKWDTGSLEQVDVPKKIAFSKSKKGMSLRKSQKWKARRVVPLVMY